MENETLVIASRETRQKAENCSVSAPYGTEKSTVGREAIRIRDV